MAESEQNRVALFPGAVQAKYNGRDNVCLSLGRNMESSSTNHLSPEALTAFANGQLDGSAYDAAEEHVLVCQSCCDALRSVDVAVAITLPKVLEEASHDDGDLDSHHGRFLPGEVINARYRIVSLLGMGGMGEVYRADDLKLDQSVALKFLGRKLAGNDAAQQRLHAEVRLAREIAHPNVCRVYDVDEVDGQSFLSMEYIDGEDLKSLLQRIGRLPNNKATELSRQLCAGLSAAHQQGILHRDLKPANVMIDGRGQLRITDFGLAVLSQQTTKDAAGTPAYMSPEQVAFGESTIRSDLYSLGLVIAEMFSGQRVISGSTLDEVNRIHSDPIPPKLSHDIAPEIEPVIRQCIAKLPADRPLSAEEVLHAIPASELDDLLAAGETPSPEFLAAKHQLTDVMHPTFAKCCIAALLLGLVALLCMPIGSLGGLLHNVDFPLEPAILAHKARQIIIATGYFADEEANWPSEAHGFLTNNEFDAKASSEPMRKHDAYHYWYRMHRLPMSADRRMATRVTFDNPAPFAPGMVVLRLDLNGRLVDFHTTPRVDRDTLPQTFDPRTFFTKEMVGVDFSEFDLTENSFTPQTAFDQLLTWKQRDVPDKQAMRLFAATFRGQLTACRVMWPKENPDAAPPGKPIEDTTRIAIVLLLGLACIVARTNVNRGRSDRKGAATLAWSAIALTLVGWLFGATLTGNLTHDSRTFLTGLQTAVFIGAVMWCFYLALEPFVRRFWPTTLITWTRLLRCQFRDRELGRDILLGLTAGILCHVLMKLWIAVALTMGITPRPTIGVTPEVLLGMRESFSQLVNCGLYALTDSMFLLMFLFAIRLPIRVKGIATVLFVLFFVLQFSLLAPEYAIVHVLFWTTAAVLLTRFGLVSLACFQFVRHAVDAFPLPADLSHWYAGYALIPCVMIALLGIYAFSILSTRSRKVVGAI